MLSDVDKKEMKEKKKGKYNLDSGSCMAAERIKTVISESSVPTLQMEELKLRSHLMKFKGPRKLR